eukprot:gnl/MRDRNA2_/MRDRNA2_64941_c0_seq1.p1 gnl/MRDRNA2_/MRDRNA2_64941_c0~~gnl/MRDRNA2_/MRDRNA2_64941_c0_seq1.p1  ORF type:complete len:115 (+),score=24.17 gnl/MRDRNA2_/MRDRNA2_64941_c0_seq1:160-504(+)
MRKDSMSGSQVLASLLSHFEESSTVVPQEEYAAEEEIVALYHLHGDPTGGHASQHASLFVSHDVKNWEFDVDGLGTCDIQQTPSDLSKAGVTGCVVWNGAVVLGKSFADWLVQA